MPEDLVWRILVPLIASGIGGLITSAITIAVLRTRLSVVEARTEKLEAEGKSHAEKLEAQGKKHADRMGEIALERANCQIVASNSYATRGELIRLTVENSQQMATLGEKISEGLNRVHQRTDTLLAAVARLEGERGT